jgi:C-terminal processing protease CtpA/Prc
LQAKEINKGYRRMRPNPQPLEKPQRVTEIIKSRLQGQIQSGCNGKIKFGMLTDRVGYIRIAGFAGYSTKRDFDDWVKALHETLDKALAGCHGWRGLVIDVRVNGGGSDVLGVEVASRLATKDYLAFAKRARSDPEDPAQFTPPQETWVRVGKEPRFGGKVVVLTGLDSVSAAETFTMALMGRTPAVTRIGQNTQGVFSDILGRTLPNGWRFGLPNEIFLTESGKTFDKVGIPPDIAVPVFPPEDLSKGRDSCLEKALELLGR